MFNLDLTKFFRAEAPRLRLQIKKNLASRRGWKGDPAPSNSKATIRRKGKNHWLSSTGETARKGIGIEIGRLSMRIFAKDTEHSGRYRYRGKIKRSSSKLPTYEEIFEYADEKKNYSGAFGVNKGNRLYDRMEFEASKQTIRYLMKELPKKIMLKL